MSKNIFFILLLTFFAWWVFLRSYDLWWASFWMDEWYSSITSYYAVSNNFAPILETWSYTFSRYFFTFFQWLSFDIFGISDLTARLPSLIFGVLIMVVSVLFAYELLQKHKYRLIWTIWISFLSFFSTWQIIWSRQARFYELLSLLLLLWIYLLYKFETSKKIIYFVLFSLTAWIWSIYHPFLFSLFAVGWIYIAYYFVIELLSKKDFKTTLFKNIKYAIVLLGWYLLYYLVDLWFKYIETWWVQAHSWIPGTYDLPQHFIESYINFYTQILVSELGILYLAFILWFFYLVYIKKYAYLIIFAWIFLINFYVITQKWVMVHSRYMYHLFSIITIFWGYLLFLFLAYFYDKWISTKNIFYKLLLRGVWWATLFMIIFSFNMNFLPKTTYYMDHTSPQPDFESAYEFVNENYPEKRIISWMPHICVWYNLDNQDKCQYALRVNITWRQSSEERILDKQEHNYTATPYIDDLSKINNQIFVLENLSLTMSINKDIIDYVINNCDKIFEDFWNWQRYNYIWAWKCSN